MSCKIQAEYAKAWASATEALSEAVRALTSPQIATMPKGQYQKLTAKAETARLASENARLSLALHRKEHKC
jgi:hypothetical protein